MMAHNSSHYSLAKSIVERLQSAGYTALFAGGSVRDLLLGRPCEDIDIATSAHPHQIVSLFQKTVTVGAQFGVVLVIENGKEFEVATFRSDTQYIDGRHPSSITLDVTAQKDAERRDFTINGMMYDPFTQKLYDYVGGQEDLKKKLIRTIGSAEDRFNEDRLRMLRAIRFKNVLHFKMEKSTWDALCFLCPSIISSVSKERIWQEFSKMHQKSALGNCLADMASCQMLQYIFPILASVSIQELTFRIDAIKKYKGKGLISAICLLFQQKEAIYLQSLGTDMHLSKQEQRSINLFLQYGTLTSIPDECNLVHLFAHEGFSDYLQAASVCKNNPEKFIEEQTKAEKDLFFWISQIKHNKYFISASDLLNLGVAPGREMGRLLKRLFYESLRQRMTKKEQILHTLLDTPIHKRSEELESDTN